mmetsp:Transcript_33313/g.58435  ORF Transcript_33313/g.58435 Transcript_33313/m.58435 type:complete len:648 (-) Transcript_33313:28-1971(-)
MEGRKRLYDQIASNKQAAPAETVHSQQDLSRLSDSDLYRQLKQAEHEFLELIRSNPRAILDQHRSYTSSKLRLVECFTLYMVRTSTLENVRSKEIDKRLWKCIKNELKAAESVKRGDSRNSFDRLIIQDKDLLTILIKQLTETHHPLAQPNLPNCASRKALGQLLLGIGEILKLKAKQDKAVLKNVKEFYSKAQRVNSHSGKIQESLGLCLQAQGDNFGCVYWLSRALACHDPSNCSETLKGAYSSIRDKWGQRSQFTANPHQPAWYISFCLSFLHLQGIYFASISTESTDNLFKIFETSLPKFIRSTTKDNEQMNSNLLVSMVHLFIFSIHVMDQGLQAVSKVSCDNYEYFNTKSDSKLASAYEFCFKFIEHMISEVNNSESVWLAPVGVFLYWVSSYRNLKERLTPELKAALENLRDRIYSWEIPQEGLSTQVLLPEDTRSIGFSPLHDFFVSSKELTNEVVAAAKEADVRTLGILKILDSLDLSRELTPVDLPIDLDFLDTIDTPGLFIHDPTPVKQTVVIDGPNVAMRHGNGKFSSKGLRLAIEYFISRGFEVKAILPDPCLDETSVPYLKGKRKLNYSVNSSRIPDSVGLLKELDSQGLLIKTPAWDYDDSYCIEYARNKNATIITNDRYWDHIEKDRSLQA